MKIQVAVACDFAVEYQHKLCIIGTFETIEALQFPVVKSHCSIALQILWSKAEEGTHSIKVKFMDEDGVPTLKAVDSSINVSVPAGHFLIVSNHILNIQQLKFAGAGSYLVVIDVDGKMETEIPLQVLHTK